MKLRMICHRCHLDNNTSISDTIDGENSVYEEPTIELDKWPYIEMRCKNGHRQRYMLATELYELLFEQATRCLIDGYYREAISTYNAALERFFEYAIEMMLKSHTDVDFTAFWKDIDKQSERQLGAYYALWVSTFHELPPKLIQNKVELRNAVVHKGKLASRAEAVEFGGYVYNYIVESSQKLDNTINAIAIKKALRITRLCEKDFAKEANDPIVVDYYGEQAYQATSSLKVLCLLNNPRIKRFEDCLTLGFGSQNLGLV